MARRPFPRVGAWVVLEGRAGIIAEFDGIAAEVHFPDHKTGETCAVARVVPSALLVQARLADIPACRRGYFAVNPERAAVLGYR